LQCYNNYDNFINDSESLTDNGPFDITSKSRIKYGTQTGLKKPKTTVDFVTTGECGW